MIIINYNNNIYKPDTTFTIKYNLRAIVVVVVVRFQSIQIGSTRLHAFPSHHHAQVLYNIIETLEIYASTVDLH